MKGGRKERAKEGARAAKYSSARRSWNPNRVARDCGDRLFCETVTKESIDYDKYIYFAERAYLELTTMIGPSPEEIISPVILAFDPIEDDEEEAAGASVAAAAVLQQSSVRLRGLAAAREVVLEGW